MLQLGLGVGQAVIGGKLATKPDAVFWQQSAVTSTDCSILHRGFPGTEVKYINFKFLTGGQARPFQNIRPHVHKTNAHAVFNAVIRPPMGAILASFVGFFHYSGPPQLFQFTESCILKKKKPKNNPCEYLH